MLALFGAAAGQGVVWYTGQFYALFFLTITLKLDWLKAYLLVGAVARSSARRSSSSSADSPTASAG